MIARTCCICLRWHCMHAPLETFHLYGRTLMLPMACRYVSTLVPEQL